MRESLLKISVFRLLLVLVGASVQYYSITVLQFYMRTQQWGKHEALTLLCTTCIDSFVIYLLYKEESTLLPLDHNSINHTHPSNDSSTVVVALTLATS